MIEDILRRLDDTYTIRLSREPMDLPSFTGEEENLTNYFKDRPESYGHTNELQYIKAKRHNLYGVLNGTKPGKRLNYNAHSAARAARYLGSPLDNR
jgi:acetylornithine deacetylase/succinyl-diaminopimelate desuccinylase-like protein